MVQITDYDTLAATVKTWCARSDTKFSAQIPTFVSLTEDRIYHGLGDDHSDPLYSAPLRAPKMELSITVALVDGVATLPSDFLEARRINRSGDRNGIEYLPPQRFSLEGEYLSLGSLPLYYTTEAETLKVIPTYTGNVQMLYYRKFPAITDGNKVGTLITNYGNLYFSSGMHEAFSWMQEPELALGHIVRYRSQVAGLNRTNHKTRHPGQRHRVHMRSYIP